MSRDFRGISDNFVAQTEREIVVFQSGTNATIYLKNMENKKQALFIDRDGTLTVKMGKYTQLEEALRQIGEALA